MVKRIDIMTDIETLGTNADSTVIQVSAIAFDIETGQSYGMFNQRVDIEQEEKLNIDGSTLKWWLNTDKDLLHRLINGDNIANNPKSLSGKELFERFAIWLKQEHLVIDIKNVYLWGNGILFDNNMIKTQMGKYGIEYPIYFKNDRDMRTILELASMKKGINDSVIKDRNVKENETKHDALDDCAYQIRVVCDCYNSLMNQGICSAE